MRALNFPELTLTTLVRNDKSYVFDPIRKKYLLLTPEEWVRQHMLLYLIVYHGYPKSMIKTENGLKVNKLTKRTDIVVFGRDGNPWMLVECKSFEVKLDQQTFFQVATYNTFHRAPYLLITNGLEHYCCEVDHSLKTTIPMNSIPPYHRD